MQGLLHLSSQGMFAYSWRKGAIKQEGHFLETESGRESFRSYLREHRTLPFRLLIDLPDEAYRLDTIPSAHGADRRAIIQRRLAQMTSTTPYAAALPLGKERTGRGNEILMLATLTRPTHITPWLDICGEAGTLIKQITSPPFLLASLLQGLGLHQGQHLLFMQGSGGLRQTYFDAGQLQFSRLTATSLSPEDAATICFDDAYKVRHYLGSGARPAVEAKFHVLLPKQDVAAFETRRTTSREVQLHIIELSYLETELGIRSSTPSDFPCDKLLLHLMAKGHSSAQFAPSKILNPYHLRQWRRQLQMFSSALLGFCLIATLAYGLFGWRAAAEAHTQESRNQVAQRQYEALLQTLPSLPAPIDEVRAVSASMRALQAASRFPETTLRLLSHALDEVPEVELDRIEWRAVTSTNGETKRTGAGAVTQSQGQLTTAVTHIDIHAVSTERGIDTLAAAENLATKLRSLSDAEVEVVPAQVPDGTPLSSTREDHVSLRLIQGGR